MLKLKLRNLESKNWQKRRDLARKLATSKEPNAPDLLMELLEDGNLYVRMEAAWALAKIAHEPAIQRLTALLEDEYRSVRRVSAQALGNFNSSHAADALIDTALHDKDDVVRSSAVLSLGKIGDRRAIEPLLEMLEDENDEVKRTAISVLSKFDDARAIEALKNMAEDEDPDIREEVTHTPKISDQPDGDVSDSDTPEDEEDETDNEPIAQSMDEIQIAQTSDEEFYEIPEDIDHRKLWKGRVFPLILSSIYCGLGHIYRGKILEGVIFLTICTLLILAAFLSVPYTLRFHFFIIAFVWLAGVLDILLTDGDAPNLSQYWNRRRLRNYIKVTAFTISIFGLLIIALHNISIARGLASPFQIEPSEEYMASERDILELFPVQNYQEQGKTSDDAKVNAEFFSIQVAASGDQERAEEVQQELTDMGHPARVEYHSMNGENWYRILIGKFQSAEEARAAAEKLPEQNGGSYMIVHYRGAKRVGY